MFDQWQAGEKLEEAEAKAAKSKADDAGERKAKGVPVIEGASCACGKPVEKESPQIDQCLACFNRK